MHTPEERERFDTMAHARKVAELVRAARTLAGKRPFLSDSPYLIYGEDINNLRTALSALEGE